MTPPEKAGPSVVLVHGAYADGSSWSEDGVEPGLARVLYAVQGRVSDTLFADRTTVAAWRSRPAWYAVSRQDRTISPGLQRFMAGHMEATTVEIEAGHLSLITHPGEVTELIMNAVQAVRPAAAR